MSITGSTQSSKSILALAAAVALVAAAGTASAKPNSMFPTVSYASAVDATPLAQHGPAVAPAKGVILATGQRQGALAPVPGGGVSTPSGLSKAGAPSVQRTGPAPAYSYGAVSYASNAVRTPFGVAAAGTAYAQPNGPAPASGYSYGAVKYAPNAVHSPWGVMASSCHKTSFGVVC